MSRDAQIKKHEMLHHFSAKHPSKPTYTIFYSSIDPETGRMWCPDCEAVADILSSLFRVSSSSSDDSSTSIGTSGAGADVDKPVADIRYVGSREQWKFDADNVYRRPPFEITGVPTVLKFRDGKVIARMEEADILDGTKLEGFMGA